MTSGPRQFGVLTAPLHSKERAPKVSGLLQVPAPWAVPPASGRGRALRSGGTGSFTELSAPASVSPSAKAGPDTALRGLPASTHLSLTPRRCSRPCPSARAHPLPRLARPLPCQHPPWLPAPRRRAAFWAPSRNQPGARRGSALASRIPDARRPRGRQMEADKLNKWRRAYFSAGVTLHSVRPARKARQAAPWGGSGPPMIHGWLGVPGSVPAPPGCRGLSLPPTRQGNRVQGTNGHSAPRAGRAWCPDGRGQPGPAGAVPSRREAWAAQPREGVCGTGGRGQEGAGPRGCGTELCFSAPCAQASLGVCHCCVECSHLRPRQ